MSKVTISHKAIIKRKSLIIIMIIYGYKLDSFFITYPMFLPIPCHQIFMPIPRTGFYSRFQFRYVYLEFNL